VDVVGATGAGVVGVVAGVVAGVVVGVVVVGVVVVGVVVVGVVVVGVVVAGFVVVGVVVVGVVVVGVVVAGFVVVVGVVVAGFVVVGVVVVVVFFSPQPASPRTSPTLTNTHIAVTIKTRRFIALVSLPRLCPAREDEAPPLSFGPWSSIGPRIRLPFVRAVSSRGDRTPAGSSVPEEAWKVDTP
jgi:hypothetical protein